MQQETITKDERFIDKVEKAIGDIDLKIEIIKEIIETLEYISKKDPKEIVEGSSFYDYFKECINQIKGYEKYSCDEFIQEVRIWDNFCDVLETGINWYHIFPPRRSKSLPFKWISTRNNHGIKIKGCKIIFKTS